MPSTYLLEPPVECPPGELPWVRSFIAACRFTFAMQGDLGGRPVVESPHQYVPRRSLSGSRQRDFDRFAALIDQHGYRGRFLNVIWRYLDVPGDDGSSWRFWVSNAYFPPAERGMLNRADSARSPMLLPGAEVAHGNQDPQQGGSPKEMPANTPLSQQQLNLDNFPPEARDA